MSFVFNRNNVEFTSVDNITRADYPVLFAVVSGKNESIFKLFSPFFS